jgi:hypothetical protein
MYTLIVLLSKRFGWLRTALDVALIEHLLMLTSKVTVSRLSSKTILLPSHLGMLIVRQVMQVKLLPCAKYIPICRRRRIAAMAAAAQPAVLHSSWDKQLQ